MTQATIPSRTSGQAYTVRLQDDGTASCTCRAGQFGKPCWHAAAVKAAACPAPAYRLASMRTGRTLSTHATLDEAISAAKADHARGGMAVIDRIA